MRLDQYLNQMVHPVAAKLPRFRTHMLKTPERLKQLWMEKCLRMKEKEEAEAAAEAAAERERGRNGENDAEEE